MFGKPEKELKPDDIGTRLEHLMALQDMWNVSYGILTAPNTWHSKLEKDRAAQLQTALNLLQHYLEKGYNSYHYATEINDLPKNAKEIPDAKKDGPIDTDGFRSTL